MENIPILEGISPDEVEQMRVCFGVREERFRADTVIYDISEGRGELGLLTAGSAVIQRIDRQGGRTILEHLPTGSVFGEMLMFENVAGDSITVVAAESCRVWFMSAEHLTRRCEKACTHHSRLVENMFHIIRAFHVAGRCTDCGECTRVCPQGIPLHLLNRKFIKDINELYGEYQAGEEVGQRHPLIDFTKTDAEPSVVSSRGGANA